MVVWVAKDFFAFVLKTKREALVYKGGVFTLKSFQVFYSPRSLSLSLCLSARAKRNKCYGCMLFLLPKTASHQPILKARISPIELGCQNL